MPLFGQVGSGSIGEFQLGSGADAPITPPPPAIEASDIVGRVGDGQVGSFQVGGGADLTPVAGSPGAPTSVVVVDNNDGTLTFTFSAPADDGDSSIINYTAIWNGGSSQTGSSPLIVTLHRGENLGVGSGTVYATNTQGKGVISLPSAVLTPDDESAIYFTRVFTWPVDVPLAEVGYRIVDLTSGDLTGWITTGMVATTGMSSPRGIVVNFAVAKNNDVSFNGYIEARNHSEGPVSYQRAELNLYTNEERGATVFVTKLHTFLPSDTISSPTVQVFSNAVGTLSTDIAQTSTGVTAVSVTDKCYAYDVELAPDAFGELSKFIRWGSSSSGLYDQDAVAVPALEASFAARPFHVAPTFNSGVTTGTVAWLARKLVAGVLTDIGTWSTSGVAATVGMTSGTGQSKGFTISATLTPNNADGSFSGILLVRSAAVSPAYAVQELNVPAIGEGVSAKTVKVSPFLLTDVFTTVGRRTYQNDLGTLTALEARTTAGIVAIPEIENGYCTELDFAPEEDGSFQALILWDQDETTYVQDEVLFSIPAFGVYTQTNGALIPTAILAATTGAYDVSDSGSGADLSPISVVVGVGVSILPRLGAGALIEVPALSGSGTYATMVRTGAGDLISPDSVMAGDGLYVQTEVVGAGALATTALMAGSGAFAEAIPAGTGNLNTTSTMAGDGSFQGFLMTGFGLGDVTAIATIFGAGSFIITSSGRLISVAISYESYRSPIPAVDVSDVVTVKARFTDTVTGALVDPVNALFRLRSPSSVVTTTAPTRLSMGLYAIDVTATERGKWRFRFEASGVGQDGQFTAKHSKVH